METARTYVFTAVFAPDELPVAWVLKVAGLLTCVSRHTARGEGHGYPRVGRTRESMMVSEFCSIVRLYSVS